MTTSLQPEKSVQFEKVMSMPFKVVQLYDSGTREFWHASTKKITNGDFLKFCCLSM